MASNDLCRHGLSRRNGGHSYKQLRQDVRACTLVEARAAALQ